MTAYYSPNEMTNAHTLPLQHTAAIFRTSRVKGSHAESMQLGVLNGQSPNCPRIPACQSHRGETNSTKWKEQWQLMLRVQDSVVKWAEEDLPGYLAVFLHPHFGAKCFMKKKIF